MARFGRGRRLGLALVLLAAAVGLVGGIGRVPAVDARPIGLQLPTVGLVPTAVDAAHLPVRTEAGFAAEPVRHGSGRGPLPLVAALVGLAGALVTLLVAGAVRPVAKGRPPLRARGHAIALRAPPLPRVACA